MKALLETRELSAGYGQIRALREASIEVVEGSVTALVGSQGAGKTTLMRALSGLLRHDRGRILFGGRDVGGLPPDRRVALGISLVPEGRLIFPDFTVEQNLRIGGFSARGKTDVNLDGMFALFPRLRERRAQRGETLSGGEQQMLALARGLMSEPRLLLLDEPSLGLAPAVARLLFDTVALIRERGVTVLIVEQDIRSTLEIADRAYVMENGRIVMNGEASDLLADDSVRRAYLGM